MKFKHILGLDVGTNSLGWALIKEFENGTVEIIKTGVHIFPIGTIVDDKSNKEKTKNEQRRGYRGASRMRYRFKLRRANLKAALEKLGILPNYEEYNNVKGLGQSFELYKLRAEAIKPDVKIPEKEIGRIFMLLNKYRGFKSNSKILGKKDEEAGKVKSGYENLQKLIDASGAQTIGEYFFKMHEKAKQMYEANEWHNYNEPIDERAYNEEGKIILFNSNGIRRHHGRYTLRDMYLKEFDLIWAAQQKHYPEILTGNKLEYDEILKKPYSQRINALKEFKKTNYWHIREYCIYYQRPLKSQKKYVSNCQFERGEFETRRFEVIEGNYTKTKELKIWKKKAKKACPKSHPLFQEFKIWQKLHQISYSSTETEVFQKPLKKEWLPILVDALMYNYEIYLNATSRIKKEEKIYFGKILQEKGSILNSEDYSFYIDKADEDVANDEKNENKISGNITYSTFKEALGVEKFNQIKNGELRMKSRNEKEIKHSTLEDLWHHIYMSKDGLFKEDDWLKCVLMEETKWNFSEKQAEELISKGLVPDYGSYSSKVLKAILPFMRKGLNEFEALKATGLNYINDDDTIGEKIKLRDRISQLKYQELRNPVVERSLSKSIKLVNTVLERYKDEIDRDNFEIRIESTRQLRKPRQERENERRKNADKDRLREQYAAHLTKNKEKLGFKKDIYKYDSIVGKYELWLQMNMNESDEVFITEFKNFSKISRQEDKLKHKLWLECGRRCPYTGAIINFTDCFSSDVEIEHIIPLSRSLDDSFNNKTLTYRNTNAEKGSMTPLEFLKKKGENSLNNFKGLLKSKFHNFSDEKKKLLLAENIKADFSSNQISNSSYIAKYTRRKMQEVCRNVQFTNGSATSELRNYDWSLSNLLDKIRYEEDNQINMDIVFRNYYTIKKAFIVWYEKKVNSTDFKINWKKLNEDEHIAEFITETNDDLLYWYNQIEDFNQFRNKSGKKDRSDHRHHAIDAFVTACSSPRIIKILSTLNADREQNSLREREKFEICFDYQNLKTSISSILVSHSEKQTLIKKRKNRIKTNKGIIVNETYAPQGKLHQESFYSKINGATVRRVKLFEDQRPDKALFEKASDLSYTVKGITKWHYIGDKGLYKNTQNRLTKLQGKAFSKDEMEKTPFYNVSYKTPEKNTSSKKGKEGKPIPIVKSVRKRFNIDRTLINLPAKNGDGNIVNVNRYADNDTNALMVLYENLRTDKKGNFIKSERDFEILSLYKATSKKNPYNPIIYENGKLFLDEKDSIALNKDCKFVKCGDIVALYIDENEKENFDWTSPNLKERLYSVKSISSSIVTASGKEYEFGYIYLLKTKASKALSYGSEKDILECIKINSFKISHQKFNAIKVRINILGEIVAKGESCF